MIKNLRNGGCDMEQIELFKSIINKLFYDTKDTFYWTDLNFTIKRIDEMTNKGERGVSAEQLFKNKRFIEEVCQLGESGITDSYINEKIGDVFSEFVKKKYRLNISKWEPNKSDYPRYMLLGTDKGILAYAEFFYHRSLEIIDDEICYEYGICHEVSNLIRKVSLIYSDLDRPTFYIHFVDYPNLKGIYFETTEQIIDSLFNERNHVITFNNGKYYFSNLLEMGEFNEIIEIFYDLKKNNIQFN